MSLKNRKARLSTLIEMHSWSRPKDSAAEAAFIKKYIATLPGADQDDCKNWHVHVGETNTIFACHTDTVAKDGGRQNIQYNPVTGIIGLSKKSKGNGNVLGADDTAGVFLCTEMIKAGVAGHYIFHYGEERGAQGSRDLARKHPEWLKQYTSAIAFDRRSTKDIITHQGSRRTASDEFAKSIAEQMNPFGFEYVPDDTGMFTDTKSYVDLIPECTNLSVGYEGAHGEDETLDVEHVLKMLEALLVIDPSKFVISRDHTKTEYKSYKSSSSGWSGWSGGTFDGYYGAAYGGKRKVVMLWCDIHDVNYDFDDGCIACDLENLPRLMDMSEYDMALFLEPYAARESSVGRPREVCRNQQLQASAEVDDVVEDEKFRPKGIYLNPDMEEIVDAVTRELKDVKAKRVVPPRNINPTLNAVGLPLCDECKKPYEFSKSTAHAWEKTCSRMCELASELSSGRGELVSGNGVLMFRPKEGGVPPPMGSEDDPGHQVTCGYYRGYPCTCNDDIDASHLN